MEDIRRTGGEGPPPAPPTPPSTPTPPTLPSLLTGELANEGRTHQQLCSDTREQPDLKQDETFNLQVPGETRS